MERYFEITKNSKHYQGHFDYLTHRKEAIEATSKFMEEYDIPGSIFMIWGDHLWIPETNAFVEKFGEQLRNVRYKNCRSFKKNSPIGKAFTKADISMPLKPFVPFFFDDCCGEFNTRLFDYENRVYCSIAAPNLSLLKLETPVGFVEMKGSEFFKIIEEAMRKYESEYEYDDDDYDDDDDEYEDE